MRVCRAGEDIEAKIEIETRIAFQGITVDVDDVDLHVTFCIDHTAWGARVPRATPEGDGAAWPGHRSWAGILCLVGGEKTQLIIVAVVIRDAVPAALPAIVEIYDAPLPGPGEG